MRPGRSGTLAGPRGTAEPTGRPRREALRKWRLETPLDHFAKVRHQWNDAGIELYAYNLSFNNSFTDAEIDRGFEMAKAMGVKVITASPPPSAPRKRWRRSPTSTRFRWPCTATTT